MVKNLDFLTSMKLIWRLEINTLFFEGDEGRSLHWLPRGQLLQQGTSEEGLAAAQTQVSTS